MLENSMNSPLPGQSPDALPHAAAPTPPHSRSVASPLKRAWKRARAFLVGENEPMPRTRKPPTRILITRHGQTVTNVEGRFCGHSETTLTDLGREQARALAARLDGIEVHAAYTSDFGRAIETAALALEGRDVVPVPDAALRELHYGEWELQKGGSVARRWPEQHKLMRSRDPGWRPPGGEDVRDVRDRTFAALQRIMRRHKNQTVLIVTHGTAINCMLGEVLGSSVEATFNFEVNNCGLSEVVVHGSKPIVTLLNDTSHLAAIQLPVTA